MRRVIVKRHLKMLLEIRISRFIIFTGSVMEGLITRAMWQQYAQIVIGTFMPGVMVRSIMIY